MKTPIQSFPENTTTGVRYKVLWRPERKNPDGRISSIAYFKTLDEADVYLSHLLELERADYTIEKEEIVTTTIEQYTPPDTSERFAVQMMRRDGTDWEWVADSPFIFRTKSEAMRVAASIHIHEASVRIVQLVPVHCFHETD